MLRIVGIGLITVVISIWGESRVVRQRKGIRALGALLRLIEGFEAKARSFHTPIKSFLSEYKDELLNESGLIKSVLGGMSFAEAVRDSADTLCLEGQDVSLLSELGEALGQYSLDEELKRCGYYAAQIRKLLDSAKEKLPGETRLLRSSGIMCGILAAVFLI